MSGDDVPDLMAALRKSVGLPPQRDCEHGRLARCESCELATAEDRIADLEAERDRLREAGNALLRVARELYMEFSDPYGDSDMHEVHDEAATRVEGGGQR